MAVSAESMLSWCRTLLGFEARPELSLEGYLDAIPRLDALDDLPSGTVVLVRGDVDAKPGATVGEGDVRLRSMVDTLRHGIERGWRQVIFGHIGRKPEGTLAAVAARLGELIDAPVALIGDWLDEATTTLRGAAVQAIADTPPGAVVVLENTRRYAIERALWKVQRDELPAVSEKLARLAGEFAAKVSTAYVNEALSAGSLDTSSTVIPAAMRRVALGSYVAREFRGPMLRCLDTRMVIFSGLKIDKLDDLEAMVGRGKIRTVIAAGSLAMALKAAAGRLDGEPFELGVAGHAEHADKPYFIAPERIDQAQRMIERGRAAGIDFVLPIDFVLGDGRMAERLGPGEQQFDVGPKSSELFAAKVGAFIEAHRSGGDQPTVAFHNGVFGMFEDPRFEEGTRRFVGQLKRMTDAGIEVYVGGGEGGKALERYGRPDWVTHCFTAGGTVLNALGSEPVPYLLALYMAAAR